MSTVTPETKREGRDFSESHLREAQILRFLEGALNENEAENVQAHLDSCRDCFALFAFAAKYSLNPPTPKEAAEFEKTYVYSSSKRLERLFSKAETDKAQANSLVGLPQPFMPRAPKIPSYWRPVLVAVAAVLLGIFVGMPQFYKWRSNNLVTAAKAEFVQADKITSREEARFSGIEYDELTVRMGPEENLSHQPMFKTLQKALALHPDNFRAEQLLGELYFRLSNDTLRAQQHLQRAYSLAPQNASILNDLGALAWSKGDFEEALTKFSMALQQDSACVEAQFNQANLLQILGHTAEAKRAWEAYQKLTKLEADADWPAVAEDRVSKLR